MNSAFLRVPFFVVATLLLCSLLLGGTSVQEPPQFTAQLGSNHQHESVPRAFGYKLEATPEQLTRVVPNVARIRVDGEPDVTEIGKDPNVNVAHLESNWIGQALLREGALRAKTQASVSSWLKGDGPSRIQIVQYLGSPDDLEELGLTMSSVEILISEEFLSGHEYKVWLFPSGIFSPHHYILQHFEQLSV